MCGIVGVIGQGQAVPLLLDGLQRLEYRGYDSAGIATLVNGEIERRRASGKLGVLAASLAQNPMAGTTGIGHTRWATHGAPTENNAHPHATARVANCAPSWKQKGRNSLPKPIPKPSRNWWIII